MAKNEKCDCCSSATAIFPCVGASNAGHLSNKIAIELEKRELET